MRNVSLLSLYVAFSFFEEKEKRQSERERALSVYTYTCISERENKTETETETETERKKSQIITKRKGHHSLSKRDKELSQHYDGKSKESKKSKI